MLFDECKIIYDASYQNNQSGSDLFRRHMLDMYEILKNNFPENSKLVEVGCGKGAFLDIVRNDEYFDYRGFDTAYDGDDPKIEKRYLSSSDQIEADVVVIRHVLEHVKSPHNFVLFLKSCFQENAKIFIEVPQFSWIEKNKSIFDFTYEHVNYFDSKALCSMFDECIEFGDCFHGQYQYVLASFSTLNYSLWEEYDSTDAWEEFSFEPYLDAFKEFLSKIEDAPRMWMWGGATKGVLFLNNVLNLDPKMFEKVQAVIDINPEKQEKYTPSTYLKIISPEEFFNRCDDGDLLLVANPNYYEEIENLVRKNCSKAIKLQSI